MSTAAQQKGLATNSTVPTGNTYSKILHPRVQ
jgi:hypothetical protein